MTENIKIFKITDNNLKIARNYVLHNQLVAFPTETVYGLGANAFSSAAIKACFEAKGRPSDNPLIVHVSADYDINELVFDESTYGKKLRKAFLPGPLTIVYKSRAKISPLVSCGLDTVAIRVPKNKNAQRFLKAVGVPIAAPSANRSKHISPVTAQHVFEDLGDRIPMILDGGRCEGGIESTVLDATGDIPIILRKGLITAEMVKKVVGACEYAEDNSNLNKRSPGTKYRHYCPITKTARFTIAELDNAIDCFDKAFNKGENPIFLCQSDFIPLLNGRQALDLGENSKAWASRLYYLLHESEKYGLCIGIVPDGEDELCLSVKNRFLKAFG